jgi:aconitate hydratase
VAFALAGRVDLDLDTEPLGIDQKGNSVFIKDIWPGTEELEEYIRKFVKRRFFETQYAAIFEGDAHWKNLPVPEGRVFPWDEASAYIRRPPFFEGFTLEEGKPGDIKGARTLLFLGDSITTDHISPAGTIPEDYPAGQYLVERNIPPPDFNSYGSRRGNSDVMTRGTFSNIRIKNRLVHPGEGGFTMKFPEGEEMYVFDAAVKYGQEGVPLIVLGGKEYGTGSSRDWAAKGTLLLGVKAVIAESFERIHRSNLVGMGVLPLVFEKGESAETLGLDGSEVYDISGVEAIEPGKMLGVRAVRRDGSIVGFDVTARLDNEVEVGYFKSGGILQYVLKKILT